MVSDNYSGEDYKGAPSSMSVATATRPIPSNPNSSRESTLRNNGVKSSLARHGARSSHNALRDSADGINNCKSREVGHGSASVPRSLSPIMFGTTLTANSSVLDGTSLDFSQTFNGGPPADISVGAPNAAGAPGTRRFSAMQERLLNAGIQFFHRHIRTDNEVLRRMKTNEMFQLFFEPQYYEKKAPGEQVNSVFINSVSDPSAVHVSSFILSILHQGLFSVSAFIVSIIYLSRFKEATQISLHASTWRPLFLTSLLIADKMWEDKPVRNSSLAKLFPVLSNAELNRMENKFLLKIRFNVQVKSDLFTSFCEKLLQENISTEISRCVSGSEYAAAFAEDESVVIKQQHLPQTAAAAAVTDPPKLHHPAVPQANT
ncbi:hypothetical protein FOZ63_004174, partial [Perkinsus olseni]